MFLRKSLIWKILIPVIASIAIAGVGLSIYNINASIGNQNYLISNFKEKGERDIKTELSYLLESGALSMKSKMEESLDAVRTLSQAFSSPNNGNLNRLYVISMLKNLLIKNKTFLGIYAVWEPNAFDGLDSEYANSYGHGPEGRFAPYWSINDSGKISLVPLKDYNNTSMDENGIRKGDYYLLPKETGKEVMLDPYEFEVQGKVVKLATVSSPVMINGKFKGIVGIDISLDFLQDLVDKGTKKLYNGSSTIAVVSNRGLIGGFSGRRDLIGTKIETELFNTDSDLVEVMKAGESCVYIDKEKNTIYAQSPISIGKTGTPWSLIMQLPADEVFKEIHEMEDNMKSKIWRDAMIQVILSASILLAAIFVISITIRKLLKPVKEASKLAKLTAKGIINGNQVKVKSEDEIGVLVNDMNSIILSLKAMVDQNKQIASGDLTLEIVSASDEDEIAESTINMLNKIKYVISEVGKSVSQVNEGARQISESSQSLSHGTSQQASSLEEITASLNEISSQVQEHMESAIETNKINNDAMNKSLKGSAHMKELVEAMNDINKSANEIDNIVKVIDDIAFQTNLLALNADIEAARVGKYGKGFAVVAKSVRTLATKSQNSVKETSQIVEETINNIRRGVELVEKTSAELEEIKEGSIRASELSKESAQSSQEQARGIEQINAGIGSIEEVVQNNSASAEENAASSEELASQSKRLSELISYFKTESSQSLAHHNITETSTLALKEADNEY